jgi:hypothetical protein
MRCKLSDLPPVPPGYNITSSTFQPVVRLDEETGARDGADGVGLVPYWIRLANSEGSIVLHPPSQKRKAGCVCRFRRCSYDMLVLLANVRCVVWCKLKRRLLFQTPNLAR